MRERVRLKISVTADVKGNLIREMYGCEVGERKRNTYNIRRWNRTEEEKRLLLREMKQEEEEER